MLLRSIFLLPHVSIGVSCCPPLLFLEELLPNRRLGLDERQLDGLWPVSTHWPKLPIALLVRDLDGAIDD